MNLTDYDIGVQYLSYKKKTIFLALPLRIEVLESKDGISQIYEFLKVIMRDFCTWMDEFSSQDIYCRILLQNSIAQVPNMRHVLT